MPQPFVPVPGTLQANVRFTLAGQLVENVLCFQYQGTPFGTAVSGIHALLGASWWNTLRACISNQITSVETYYTDLSDQAGPVSSQPPFTNASGAHASHAVPNNVAFVITHRTANRGKSYRGRSYIAAMAQDFVVGNTVTTAGVNNCVLAFEALRTAASAALVPFVIVSRRHDKAWRTVGLATVVTTCVARDSRVDTQRGRLPR